MKSGFVLMKRNEDGAMRLMKWSRSLAFPLHNSFISKVSSFFIDPLGRLHSTKTKKQPHGCFFVLVEISGIEPLTS